MKDLMWTNIWPWHIEMKISEKEGLLGEMRKLIGKIMAIVRTLEYFGSVEVR